MLTDHEYEIIQSFDWTGVDLRKLIHDVQNSPASADAFYAFNMTEKEQLLTQIFRKMSEKDIDNVENLLYQNVKNPKNEYTNDIFIVHSDQDSQIAIALENELLDIFGHNIRIFNSSNPEKIEGGYDWFHSIIEIHRTSKLGLVIITENALENKWIHFETGGFFLRNDTSIIPLFFNESVLGSLSFPIKGIQEKKLWEVKFRQSLIVQIAKITGISSFNYDDDRFCRNVLITHQTIEHEIDIEVEDIIRKLIDSNQLFSDRNIYSTQNIYDSLLSLNPALQKSISVLDVYKSLKEIASDGFVKKMDIDGAEIESTPWRRIL